jgi:hypothetical protein
VADKGARFDRVTLAQCGRCELNGLDDLWVAGATTEVAAERGDDRFAIGVGFAVEESLCGHQHAGRAIAALNRANGEERGLQWMGIGRLAQALHGVDPTAHHLPGEQKTGALSCPVDDDGARATLTLHVTGLLCAGESQVVTKKRQEWLGGIGVDGDRAAVECE